MLKNIPPITRNLLFINIILFMAQQVISTRYGDVLTELFGLHFVLAPAFRIYQPLTYMFLHASWSHVLLNMFSLWMFGRIIEQTMGQKRFIIYYLICGVGAAFCQELWQFGEYYFSGMAHYDTANVNGVIMPMSSLLDQWVTIGASGACYGVLLAFGLTFPNERIMLLFPPIPMKAKYFVIGYAAIEAYSAFTSNGNVAHFAHLGGMFFGWLIFRYWRKQTERRQAAFQGWNNYRGTQQSGGYNTNSGSYQQNKGGFLQQIRTAFEKFGAAVENFFKNLFSTGSSSQQQRQGGNYSNGASPQNPSNSDQAYNAQRRAQQARMDEILEKVRRSGYASLTEAEKQELFNNSRR